MLGDAEPGALALTAAGDTHGAASLAVSYATKHSCRMILGVYPKELKTHVLTELCTQMFIAALFLTVETRKQPRDCSVMDIQQVMDE